MNLLLRSLSHLIMKSLLLTVRNETGTTFCEPIGHIQKDGDFIFSWQPMNMSEIAKQKAIDVAKKLPMG